MAIRGGWSDHRCAYVAGSGALFLTESRTSSKHPGRRPWRSSELEKIALGVEVGLRAYELDDFAAAFEHEQMDATAALLEG